MKVGSIMIGDQKSFYRALVLVVLIAWCSVTAQAQWAKNSKKLIQLGSGITEDDVQRDIRKMEEAPFDGLVFHLRGYGKAFEYEKRWDKKEMESALETLDAIEWNTFTDNFPRINVDSRQDWFNDEHWDVILSNVKLLAEAAQVGRCKGICIDPEPYSGVSPWSYGAINQEAEHHKTRSFKEYCEQVRKRGSQYMEAIQSVYPDVHIMTLFLLSAYEKDLKTPFYSQELQSHEFGMYFAFINGLVDAMGPEVTLTDGNEWAYGYTSKAEFDQAYVDIKQRHLDLVDPQLRSKYHQHVQVGASVYTDKLLGGRPSPEKFMTPSGRLRLFEHNVYHALDTADQYAWFYSAKINWFTGLNVPEGAYDAIRRAKQTVAQHQRLGIDVTKELADSKQAYNDFLVKELETRSYTVGHTSTGQESLVIDGQIDDSLWKNVQWTKSFVPLKKVLKLESAQKTYVKMAWDDTHFYVAFKCHEPKVLEVKSFERRYTRDDNIWGADAIEVFVCDSTTERIYHLAVSSTGAQWDAVISDDSPNDMSWNGTWQSGIAFDEDGHSWTAEFAIAWDQIGGKPQIDEQRKANFTRLRDPDPKELSGWSPQVEYFNEIENFGTLLFQ